MAEVLPISVHILTRNSERTLPRALETVTMCREILLIDGGSTDRTRDIGKRYGVTAVEQPTSALSADGLIRDFAAVRNVALQASTQSWILVLDSDEYLSPELQGEIAAVATSQKEPCAYLVPRRYVLENGDVVMHATTYPNERLYFFHRDAVVQWIKPVHERPELRPGAPIKRMRGASLAPLGTIAEYQQKNERYLRIERERSRSTTWGQWLRRRVLHTLRSRLIATIRLLWIWLTPRAGTRLPLRHELIRYWYAWRLIVETRPR